MKFFYPLSLLCCFLFASCNNQPANKNNLVTLNPNDSLVVVNQGVFHFGIGLPKDLMIENDPVIEFNGATGELGIKIGESFYLVMTKEQKSIESVLGELNEEGQLFDNKIIEQTDKLIVYQQILPTGEAYFYHLYANSVVDEKWYSVKTWDLGEFTLDDIGRMKQAVLSMRSAE